MHLTLPESGGSPRERSGYLGSVVFHGVLVAALVAHRAAVATSHEAPVAVPVRFASVRPPVPSEMRVPSLSRLTSGIPTFATSAIDIPVAIPSLHQSVTFTTSIDEPAFAPGMFASTAVPPTGRPASGRSDSLWTPRTVDRAVEPLVGNPVPRYPDALRAMGLEGSVTVHFVVDTLGRAEALSISIMKSTHAQFERAVLEVFPRLRFRPAEVGTRKVPQIVEQTFQFAIRR